MGIAGGNGLDLIDPGSVDSVYGFDINPDYLEVCKARYRDGFGDRLRLVETRIDRSTSIERVDLLIANLIVEYVGVEEFAAFASANARSIGVLSCVIQHNDDEGFVSSTDHSSSFDGLASVASEVDPETLASVMSASGFVVLRRPAPRRRRPADVHPGGRVGTACTRRLGVAVDLRFASLQAMSRSRSGRGRLVWSHVRVFLLGGTGAIGRPTLRALLDAGHDVSTLVRSPERAAQVQAAGGSPVEVSMFDPGALARSFRDHDVVMNLATSMPSSFTFIFRRAWAPTERVRIEGSANVADAAVAAGVPKLIQESVAMLYPDMGSDWIDESVIPERYPNAIGNLAAESSAARFGRSGGTAIVLRLGLFYGPGARHSEQFLSMAQHHVLPVLGAPRSYLSSIHMTDAAAAVRAALDAPTGTYNVVDDEPLTKREFANALARAAGAKPWLKGPGRLALLLGDRTTSLTRSLRVTNRRFRETTGWQPQYPSARDGWLATAAES